MTDFPCTYDRNYVTSDLPQRDRGKTVHLLMSPLTVLRSSGAFMSTILLIGDRILIPRYFIPWWGNLKGDVPKCVW